MSKRDDITALAGRVAQLESELAQLRQILTVAGPVLRDSGRLAELGEQASRLSAAAETRLREVQARAGALGVGKPRFEVALNTVYHADTAGYVSMVFYSGATGAVRILAGRTNPPIEPACFPGDQYVGAFIRPGEYWMVVPAYPGGLEPSFSGMFTPLY